MTQQRCPKCYPRICECRELKWADLVECAYCGEFWDRGKCHETPGGLICPLCAAKEGEYSK